MTSASLSGVRTLPCGLGNKEEPPPSRPPVEEVPRPHGGGWLPTGPEKLWNVRLSLQPGGLGADVREDFPTHSCLP